MKASRLRDKLNALIERHGDLDVRGVFDQGHGGGDVDVFWYLNPYPSPWPQDHEPHFVIEVSEHGEKNWRRMPEEHWPPVDEREE